jgi:GT2 family glycosyltransferase
VTNSHASESPIDVLVVSYNSAAYLPRLAESLRHSPLINSVTLVDNVSTDGSAELASSLDWGVPAHTHIAPENLGFGAAMNLGAQLSASRFHGTELLIINPDVISSETMVGLLHADLMSDSRIAAVGASLATSSGSPVSSARRFPTPSSIARRKVSDYPLEASAIPVDWICGAVMLWRRKAFDEVGGFSSDYFLYFEDVDICRTAWGMGWKIAANGSATGIHDQGHGEPTPPHLRAINRMSRRHYARKWFGLRGILAALIADGAECAASRYHGVVR